MKQSTLLQHYYEVFSKWNSILLFLIGTVLMGFLFYIFTEAALIKGNLGLGYFYLNLFFQILISILFGMVVALTVYKFKMFNSFSIKDQSSSVVGTVLASLVSGCAACSISLASYLGLAGLVALLPWYGLELKILATLLLMYSVYDLGKHLKVCKVTKR